MRWTVFCFGLCLFADVSRGDPNRVWLPPALPPDCKDIRIEALLIDVSRSMYQGGQFEDVRKTVSARIKGASRCSLEVVGAFGMTADVVHGEFVVDSASRRRLIKSVADLKPTHQYTNFDEAAKLVELLAYQVRAEYGNRGGPLWVNAYTDGQSEPSPGKAKFSLAEYLAIRMGARHIRVTSSKLESVEKILVQGDESVQKPDGAAKNKKKVETRGAWEFWPLLAGAAMGGLLLLAALLWRTRLRSVPVRVPLEALLISESFENGEAQQPRVLSTDRRIEVAAHVQVVFSTDANSATYVVASLPGVAEGELFRIEPLAGGFVRVQSRHPGLTVNGGPLGPDLRLRVNLSEPIRVRVGPREFNIIGVFGRPRPFERQDEVFKAEALHQ